MKNIFYVSVTIISTLFMSCNNDEAKTGVRLAVETTSGIVSAKTGRIMDENDLVLSSGSIVIREVVFDGENANSSISRTQEQQATIDYATGSISPSVFIEVPAGNYTGVNLGIELQDLGISPAVVIEGTYTNSDGELIPLKFEFNSGEVFEANASSVTIPANADIVGKITFDALEWFSVVSATQLDEASLENGVLLISESSNTDIFELVADKLDVATQAVFE